MSNNLTKKRLCIFQNGKCTLDIDAKVCLNGENYFFKGDGIMRTLQFTYKVGDTEYDEFISLGVGDTLFVSDPLEKGTDGVPHGV